MIYRRGRTGKINDPVEVNSGCRSLPDGRPLKSIRRVVSIVDVEWKIVVSTPSKDLDL